MSKSNVLENSLLLLLFNGVDFVDMADNDPATTHLWVALHVADPGEAGDQTTNEADYGDYERMGVIRTAVGWTVAANAVENTADITFPQCTGGFNIISHYSIGTDQVGAGRILYYAPVDTPLDVEPLIQPRFLAGDITGEED